MYDNHATCRVGDSTTSREAMRATAERCFSEDGCGSLFARDHNGKTIVSISGHRRADGKFGLRKHDLDKFFDKIDDYVNWLSRG